MEYALPSDLAKQFSISLKTVYNYLRKHSGKIRSKKEFWKTFVHVQDFTDFVQSRVQNYNPSTPQSSKSHWEKENWIEFEKLTKFQTQYQLVKIEIDKLLDSNDALERQVVNYAELHVEEKEERKAILNKFESLQNEYKERIEIFSKEKVSLTKRIYLLLGLCIAALLFLFSLLFPFAQRGISSWI